MLSVGELAQLEFKDLCDLEGKIKMAKVVAHQREGGLLKERMEAIAKESGFSVREVLAAPMSRAKPAPSVQLARSARPVQKYSSPKRPARKWIGRGRRPAWLVAKLNAGEPLERFIRHK